MQGYPAVGGSSILWAGQGAAFNPMQPMNQFTDWLASDNFLKPMNQFTDWLASDNFLKPMNQFTDWLASDNFLKPMNQFTDWLASDHFLIKSLALDRDFSSLAATSFRLMRPLRSRNRG
ncbi:hypothetical protein MYCTH_2305498 [Thermothelomyces thermophilus ATCC 42464]|uniref:Uncharacterized protein n=1 Tax=Thermothelomyces thermophilus (strain ATCC 42464 / BCRC 31852 / DSM 1799) TaxID=573729 RepID=G2QD51_THET4|nr:uncharacterized protein MYCTH_2305498 [Thermothelomyces thermophilus ATCC 42464]AEO58269.1 hypothetical protein MYCTH_2305498 [Thermothelomyces thermophilus ATCC 42464]